MLNLNPYLSDFRSLLRTDGEFRGCFERYLENARELTEQDVRRLMEAFAKSEAAQALVPERMLGDYSRAFDALLHAAMRLALLSASEEAFSAERQKMAVRLLLAMCDARDWVTQGKNENRFHADLWTGTLCGAVPVLYAMLYGAMTPEQRSRVARATVEKGILPTISEWLDPFDHLHALDSMGHNWYLVILCGAGLAALAFADEPECTAALESVLAAVPRWFRYPGNDLQYKKANFGADGDYIEYLGYMIYGFSSYFLLEFFYRDQTESDALFETDFLKPQPQMLMDFCYRAANGMRMANFGDAAALLSKHQHVYYCLAYRLGCGELLALQRRMTAGPNAWEDFLFYPLAVKAPDAKRLRPSRMAIYPHVGIACARTGEADDERFFAMRAGESWNHNHLDAGTFLLTDRGWTLAIDSGTCDYGQPEYLSYYTTSAAHNTLLLDGMGQDGDMFHSGTRQDGSFTGWLNAEDDGFQYMRADCAGPYAGVFNRFFRHVLLLENWVIFVDDVQAFKPGQLTWQMHFTGEARLNERGATLSSGGLRADVYPLYPSERSQAVEPTIEEGERLSPLGPRLSSHVRALPIGQRLAFRFDMDGRRAKLIVAMSRARENEPSEAPICLAHDGWEEILLTSGERRERLIVNNRADGSVMHQNAWLEADGLRTDAFLIYTCEDQAGCLQRAAMVNGSRLKLRGALDCGAPVKLDACFTVPDKRARVNACMDAELTLRTDAGDIALPIAKGESVLNGSSKGAKV